MGEVMLLILGQGYSGGWIAAEARARGLAVQGVRRMAGPGIVAFDDPALPDLVASASHILSTIAPVGEQDPVLERWGDLLAGGGQWLGYLSSTGVYGDAGGAYVDEASPIGTGRRQARSRADLQWQELGGAVLRLPGIYGPGRSVFDQLATGTARRIDRPGHRFSRVHVSDISGAFLHLMEQGATGVWNVADDLPEEPRRLVEWAAALSGAELPPLLTLEAAGLSPMARAFWTERRLVSARKLERAGYRLRHPDYKAGLAAIWQGRLRGAGGVDKARSR